MASNYLVLPKGARQTEEAVKLIEFMQRPERQAQFCEAMTYDPAQEASYAMISDEVKPFTPVEADKRGELIKQDPAWWGDNSEAVTERWLAWKLT